MTTRKHEREEWDEYMKPLPEESEPTIWTETGLQTARGDLIEHGVIYIVAPDDDTGWAKITKLDGYLRTSGLDFHRTRMSEIVKYELVRVRFQEAT